MKRLFYSAVLPCLALASAAQAQAPATAPILMVRSAKAIERQAAINAIQTQLKAFGRDDYQTAIQYQSAGLRKNFPTADSFRTMMVRLYPEFAHYKKVVFGPARCDVFGRHLQIVASVTGQDSVTVPAVYLMVREGKTYHIEGVAARTKMPADTNAPASDV